MKVWRRLDAPDGKVSRFHALLLDVEPLTYRRSGGSGRLVHGCEQAKAPPARGSAAAAAAVPKRPQGYSLPDIFHLELCLFNQVCSNGDGLFGLKVGEPFLCSFSHKRFMALAHTLLSTLPPQEPRNAADCVSR